VRVLALITARGGSQRLPGKNIRPLGSRPLVTWSIEVATGVPEICDVLLSTDDETIAGIGRNSGAMVPWLRPATLATDTTSSGDVALHAVNWYESVHGTVDGLMLLQPTSPFRTRTTLMRGLESFRAHQYRSVIAVSHAKSHPMWCFELDETSDTMRPFVSGPGMPMRSQDLPRAFVVNGVLYLAAPHTLRTYGSFFSHDMVPLVIDDPMECIDIDTEWDWKTAEAVLELSTRGPEAISRSSAGRLP
jgi:N-acylneuraminate cytidylyltransferase